MRVGQTYFKNTDFIYYAIQEGAIDLSAELVTAHPPALGEMLLRGEVDVAPISSIIYGQHPEELVLLPDFSISAFGETGSILLFSDDLASLGDLEGKKVALPGTSATSSVLLDILLREKEIGAEFVHHPEPDLRVMLRGSDAALLIGDHALAARGRGERVLADLGEEWRRLTGLRMVYALWAVRRRFAEARPEEVDGLYEKLSASRRYAYDHFLEVAAALATRLGISAEAMAWHLSRLDYSLGTENRAGLGGYFALASKYELAANPRLEFFKLCSRSRLG
ncbi:MAG: menaquinone biosynthesis protein [Euryarchaeota archaeon]|nr:menaquinone biosynthesis protein [Euryarchaeota archaeon]